MPFESATPSTDPADRFAAGHLGELTAIISTDLVDEAIAAANAGQQRIRRLPTRVVIYLLLAAVLFTDVGYRHVLARLANGVGVSGPVPGSSALSQAFRRIGPAPLAELFSLVSGPAAGSADRWRGQLVCAIDGTLMTIPDTPANATVYGRPTGRPDAPGGYPMLRLLTLVACRSRTIIDAVFGSIRIGETTYAPGLLPAMGPGMIVLADRNFASAALIEQIAATGADLLVRVKQARRFTTRTTLADGTVLTRIGATPVRVIDATITVTLGQTGQERISRYRLVTTLTDPDKYPACDVVDLYHQRWEIETAYRETKSGLLSGRVLRARTPAGVVQEVYAILTAHQALRLAIGDAALVGHTEPNALSFTIALNTARDQINCARASLTRPVSDLLGNIGRALLANILPPRRSRSSPRVIKRAISKHRAKGAVDRRHHNTTVTTRLQPTEP